MKCLDLERGFPFRCYLWYFCIFQQNEIGYHLFSMTKEGIMTESVENLHEGIERLEHN